MLIWATPIPGFPLSELPSQLLTPCIVASHTSALRDDAEALLACRGFVVTAHFGAAVGIVDLAVMMQCGFDAMLRLIAGITTIVARDRRSRDD
jgi:hypothetical protein